MRWRSIWTGALTDMPRSVLPQPPPGRRTPSAALSPRRRAPARAAPPDALLACESGRARERLPRRPRRAARRVRRVRHLRARSTRSPASRTSRYTRSSTAARSRPASPSSQGGHIMAMRDQGLVNQVFDEQKLRALQGEMAVGHVRYSTTGANSWENSQPVWRADKREVALGAQRQPDQRRRAARRAARGAASASARRRTPRCIAALLSTHDGDSVEDARGRRHAAGRGRLLDGRDDQGPRGRVPRSGGPAAAVARHARRPLLRGLRDLRVRHHRREVPARRAAGRDRVADRGRAPGPPGRSRPTATRCACSSTSTSRGRTRGSAARCSRSRAAADGRDPGPRGAGRGRPRDRRARLRQPGRARLRARVRAPAGRRLRQEPLRRPHVHPAGPGAAQARPADEVQPAARGGRGQAAGRRRRLDRARQHDAPDRRRCCATRARSRSTCGSPRRRSATPATTASTCPRARR